MVWPDIVWPDIGVMVAETPVMLWVKHWVKAWVIMEPKLVPAGVSPIERFLIKFGPSIVPGIKPPYSMVSPGIEPMLKLLTIWEA